MGHQPQLHGSDQLQRRFRVGHVDRVPAGYGLHQLPLPSQLQDEHGLRHGAELLRARACLQLAPRLQRRRRLLRQCDGLRLPVVLHAPSALQPTKLT